MRREVARYAWAKRGETRFPVVQHRDSDGTDRPISDDEVTIMTICAGALAEFFTENRDLLTTAGDLEPVCTGYSDPESAWPRRSNARPRFSGQERSMPVRQREEI